MLTIGIHGSEKSTCSTKSCAEGLDATRKAYSPEQLAQVIMNSDKYKKTPNISILLWSCSTARKFLLNIKFAETYAGRLHKLLSKNVLYAATGDIEMNPIGESVRITEGAAVYSGPVFNWQIRTYDNRIMGKNGGAAVEIPGVIVRFDTNGHGSKCDIKGKGMLPC